jgi:hypothetical protein
MLRIQVRQLEIKLQTCERDPKPFALTIDGVEATQSIQDMSQSVPLVANKTTVVRIYLSYSLSPTVTVSGHLAVGLSSVGPPVVVIASTNHVVLDPSQVGKLDAKRRNAQLSLNFVLPAQYTSDGPLYVWLNDLSDVNTGAPFDLSHVNSFLGLKFSTSSPLRLRILGMRYQYGTPPVAYIPRDLDFELINSWLTRAYPVAQVLSSHVIVDANVAPPFNCGQVNSQVAAIRALDMSFGADKRTHYFGLVYDGGFWMRGCSTIPSNPDPSAVGSGPTGSATWGWDFDGSYGDWYTGHELGHTFGRLHPGSGCGESSDDPNYPFPKGQLANADDAFVGFDVGDPAYNLPMAALPGTDWHDVMTYCNYQWLSSYTYEGIRTRLIAEDALGAGASPGANPGSGTGAGCGCMGRPDERFPDKIRAERIAEAKRNLVSVVGSVNLTRDTGKIEYVNPLTQGEPSGTVNASQVILRVKGGDGNVLHEYPVAVKPLACLGANQDRLGMVDVAIGVDATARSIELLVAGHVVDTFSASATLPGVRALARRAGERGDLSFTWETDAKPGDKHTYAIQVSTDHGQSWQTLAVGHATPEINIDKTQFKGVDQILVRVIATDGFSRSVVTTEAVPIGPN